MSDIDYSALLTEIITELKSINQSIQSLQSLKDLDHDQDLNQSDQSDQIRSDQISNDRSNMQTFLQIMDKLAIDYEHLDLESKSRSITYFLENQNRITSKKGYIITMLKDCEHLRKPPKVFKPKEKDQDISRHILGNDPSLVEEKALLLDENIFNLVYPNLSSQEQKMFCSFQKVMSADLLKNIFTAKAMNMKII